MDGTKLKPLHINSNILGNKKEKENIKEKNVALALSGANSRFIGNMTKTECYGGGN